MTQDSAADDTHEVLDGVTDSDVGALAGAAVLDLDVAVDEAAAHRDDRGYADQLGVLELHARADLGTVVVDHLEAGGGQVGSQCRGCLEDRRVLAGRDEVYVGGGHLARPD